MGRNRSSHISVVMTELMRLGVALGARIDRQIEKIRIIRTSTQFPRPTVDKCKQEHCGLPD